MAATSESLDLLVDSGSGGTCWKWPILEAFAFSRVCGHVQASACVSTPGALLPSVSHVLMEAMHFRLTELAPEQGHGSLRKRRKSSRDSLPSARLANRRTDSARASAYFPAAQKNDGEKEVFARFFL